MAIENNCCNDPLPSLYDGDNTEPIVRRTFVEDIEAEAKLASQKAEEIESKKHKSSSIHGSISAINHKINKKIPKLLARTLTGIPLFRVP